MQELRAVESIDSLGASTHLFDRDTAVQEHGAGRFSATISTQWDRLGGLPNGGYLLAVCLQALARALPAPHPLVVSAFFLRPGVHGAAEIQVQRIRAGTRVASGQAQLIQDGKERVRVLATFTDLAQATGRTAIFAPPPNLPPPEQCIDPRAQRSLEGVTIADRIDYRVPAPAGWWWGTPTGQPRSEVWIRFREPRDADLMSLPLLVDSAAAAVLELGEEDSVTLELTVHLRNRPAPGWLACRISTRYVIGGFHEEDFEIWDSQGQLVAQSRQLALLTSADQKPARHSAT